MIEGKIKINPENYYGLRIKIKTWTYRKQSVSTEYYEAEIIDSFELDDMIKFVAVRDDGSLVLLIPSNNVGEKTFIESLYNAEYW